MSGGRRTDGGHSFEDGSPASSGGCEDRSDCEARSLGRFELTWRPQNLRELCRIVDAEADDVTVFTSEGICEDWFADADLELDRYEWMLRGDDESLASYFRRVKEYCDRHVDFLMVVTPFGSGVHTSHFVEFDPTARARAGSTTRRHASRALSRPLRPGTTSGRSHRGSGGRSSRRTARPPSGR